MSQRTQVERNEVAEVVLSTRTPVALDNHDQHESTGRFVIVDDKDVSGGGIIFGHAYTTADHVSTDIVYNDSGASAEERSRLKGHKGATLWFTGLSGSGKSTVANALERELSARGMHCYQLDGDNLRFGLNRDLGFSTEDRQENIRRAAEVARLFADSSSIVITSLISPFREDRARAREIAREGKLPFLEIFMDAPLELCEKRDPKGLYAKARKGEIAQFTGISSPYEAPEAPGAAPPDREAGRGILRGPDPGPAASGHPHQDLKMPSYCLKAVCPDAQGIVAKVAESLAAMGCNILDLSQHTVQERGLFLLRAVAEAPADLSPAKFAAAFKPLAENLKMRWELHDLAHRPKVALLASKTAHCLYELLLKQADGLLSCEFSCVISNHPDLGKRCPPF